jgi:4-amino-4-deoxy-L-arabinose transferase-like glycosyltransferase
MNKKLKQLSKINFLLLSLILILTVGFYLRIYKLNSSPAGFFCDEASVGYNSYTILTKGVDEYGERFPLFFRAFGEYKNPIQIYSTIPLIKFFGLNEFSIRLTSVIYGTLSILGIYLLVRELFKRQKNNNLIALLSAFLLTISPWHIHLSRVALEGLNPFLFFTTIGLFLFLKSQMKPRFLPFVAIAFIFALYSYFPARIFIPLFGLGVSFFHLKFFIKNKKVTILSFCILIILLLPLMFHMFSKQGFARWDQVNIFSQPPQNQTITAHILQNYLGHFSSDFLFLKGDIDMPGRFITRHSVRGLGELYLFQLPLIFLGFIYLIKWKQKKPLLIILLWLILYPTGSMFTIDQSVQATRSIVGVIPFQILSAAGLVFTLQFVIKLNKILILPLALIIITLTTFSLFNFVDSYYTKYPLYSSDFWGWQYGPKEIIKYFLSNKSSYDELFMAGEFNGPEIFLKFYDPGNKCLNKCKIGDFNNLDFSRKQLFATTSEKIQKLPKNLNFTIQKNIYYPNGDIAFLIGEVK